MSDHDFESDGYGHGECRHCGKVEALHGDVIANARAECERATTERILALIADMRDGWSGRDQMSNVYRAHAADRIDAAIRAAIERGEHNE